MKVSGMQKIASAFVPLLLCLLVLLAFPAELMAQDGGGSAKSPIIGYVLLVLGLLLGWVPLVRPSRRKKKFAFETN